MAASQQPLGLPRKYTLIPQFPLPFFCVIYLRFTGAAHLDWRSVSVSEYS